MQGWRLELPIMVCSKFARNRNFFVAPLKTGISIDALAKKRDSLFRMTFRLNFNYNTTYLYFLSLFLKRHKICEAQLMSKRF